MKPKKKLLAIIPARAGSKGIPKKNIVNFCGRPLIYYTIDVAKKSKIFDRLIVSTDSSEIANIAKKMGAEIPFLRSKKMASDKSNVVDAVIHLLDYLKEIDSYQPDEVFLLQPTSPLRQVDDILQSYEFYCQEKSVALVTVCETHRQIFHLNKKNVLNLINKDSEKMVNRQELQQTYKQDGSMIYIIKPDILIRERDFMPQGRTTGFVVEKWKAFDIDDLQDLKLAEALYKSQNFFK